MIADALRPFSPVTPLIIVVDDNRVNRQLLTMLLQKAGQFEIKTAEDGEEALAMMGRETPDLVILDLMMPKLNGFDFCRRLRTTPEWSEVPVLVQSSLNRPEDRAKAFAAGATDYIAKPFNVGELTARVRIHLQNRALVSDLQQYRRRTEAELLLARKMQERLLPERNAFASLEEELGIRVAALFRPSSELGGDLWEYRRLDAARVLVTMVDFSGHGVGAALNTFRLHAMIQGMDIDADPARFLVALNQRLCGLLPIGQYATMLAAIIDLSDDSCRYAGAGTTQPIFWIGGETALTIGDGAGVPLGMWKGAAYETRFCPFPPGSRLFLYSDAAIEITVGDGVLDEVGLIALAQEHLGGGADAAGGIAGIGTALGNLGEIDDDLTLVVVERRS